MVFTDNGFVRIPRAIEKVKELRDPVNNYVYMKLMLLARFRETYIDGVEVQVNQILISKQCLADMLNIKLSQVRSVLATFERIGGIKTENIRNRYTLITLLGLFLDGKQSEPVVKNKPSVKREAVRQADAEKKVSTEKAEKPLPEKALPQENLTVNSSVNEVPDNKKAYGEFKNVFLTDEELDKIERSTTSPEYFINTLSADIEKGRVSGRDGHYVYIFSHIENDKKKNPEKYSRQAFEDYERQKQIAAVEEHARNNKPKIKKRKR